jgi:hypothetical protein
MKTLEQQVAELRQTVAQLTREVARKESRPAAPLSPRKGWFLGITRADFTQGTDDFFSVDVWIWTDAQWRKVPGFVIQARDWFLNAGETVEKDTKVKVEWYETTWVVTAMYCSPYEPEDPSPGAGSPGEQEASLGSSDAPSDTYSWGDGDDAISFTFPSY